MSVFAMGRLHFCGLAENLLIQTWPKEESISFWNSTIVIVTLAHTINNDLDGANKLQKGNFVTGVKKWKHNRGPQLQIIFFLNASMKQKARNVSLLTKMSKIRLTNY